jgi:TatD DNase family protein
MIGRAGALLLPLLRQVFNLIDSHAHLNHEDLLADLPGVLARAAEAGVETMLVPGFDLISSRKAVELAEVHPQILAAVGIHPHDAQFVDDAVMTELRQLAQHPKVVAIGEIGLDFYRDKSPHPAQQEAFARQIRLARELGKPIIIHQREAAAETKEIFLTEKAGELGGVWHCFSGGLELMAFVVEQGFCLGIAGPVTFPKAHQLAAVAAQVPADNLLIETDCPYLSPHPHRGQVNEPSRLPLIAQKVADLRVEKLEDMVAQTIANFQRLFK